MMFRPRRLRCILPLAILACIGAIGVPPPTAHSIRGALAASQADTVRLVNPIRAGADAQGNLYVLEETPVAIINKLSPDGKELAQWPVTVLPPGPTNAPLAVDEIGNVYIAFNLRRAGHVVGAIARYSSAGHARKAWTDPKWLNPLALVARGNGGLALIVNGLTTRQNISATLIAIGPAGRTAAIRPLPMLSHDFLKVTGVTADATGRIYIAGIVGSCSRGCQGGGPGVIFRLASVQSGRISVWIYPTERIAQGAGLVVDSGGAILTAGSVAITKISANGKVGARWGGSGCAPFKFRLISSLTSDKQNNLYALDAGNRNVQKLTSNGQWLGTLGGCPSTALPTPIPPTPRPASSMVPMTVNVSRAAHGVASMTRNSVAAIADWPKGAAMLGMTCPGVSACFAAGASVTPATGVIAHTHDGGKSWTVQTFPHSSFNNLACPSTGQCYVIGGYQHSHNFMPAVTVTRDGGATWRQQPLPAGTGPGEIACPAVTRCLVWEYPVPGASPAKVAMLITTNGGTTWKTSAAIAQRPCCGSARLACPTVQICYLYDGFTADVIKSQDGGASWRALAGANMMALSRVPPHTLVSVGGIACPGARVCYTAQGDATWGPYSTIARTQDGGKRWRPMYLAHGGEYPKGVITCPSVSTCYVIGAKQRDVPTDQIILSTKNGGRTWTTQKLPAWPLLTCPSTNVCYAGTNAGAAFKTTDGGTNWQSLS